MKRIAVLGSTGSIGRNTLEVIRNFPGKFKVYALAAHSNIDVLLKQVNEFKPEMVCVTDARAAGLMKKRLGSNKPKVFEGDQGFGEILKDSRIDKVVIAVSGSSALKPLLKAIDNKKEIAIANKEALVMAGPLISRKAKRNNVRILPIDSEQSAIWQCLEGEDKKRVKNIYLTGSGGPFRGWTKEKLKNVSLSQTLKHPRWKMGRKITIDSATLMNKGLEILEAVALFGVEPKKIKVLIHPQAIIHSMVEFIDGVIMAQLSATDMRIPIQYALSYPQRLENRVQELDFFRMGSFDFERPDYKNFPCLGLAYRAADEGGTMAAVLNAANEAGVDAFLRKKLKFLSIARIIEKTMDCHKNIKDPGLEDIFHADSWARKKAQYLIENKR
jgi:1-deoxy-D-xylulose-5-phosphate reductoisomerase